MAVTLKNLNKFVLQFLSEHNDNTNTGIEEKWMNISVQTKVKNLLNKKQVCKDPNAPKRSKSSYLYFCIENRDVVIKELGKDAKATQITSILGLKWNELKKDNSRANELKRFEKMAQEDKKRYQNEMLIYQPSQEILSKKSKVSGLKRPKSAYLYFCEDNREKVKEELGLNAKVTDITKELGLRWSLAKQNNEVEKYINLAEQEKKTSLNTKDNPEKIISNQKTNHLNGYQKFCSERRTQVKTEFPNEKASEITKRLSAEWKNMSKKEQKSYSMVPSV